MGYHLRKQQRDAMQVILIAASTNAGSRVDSGRAYPRGQDGPWPQLGIVSEGEAIVTEGLGLPRLYTREHRLRVSGYLKATTGAAVQDQLDALGMQVEAALAADTTLAGTAKFLRLVATQLELSEQLEEPAGQLDMIYEVTATAFENAPDVLI